MYLVAPVVATDQLVVGEPSHQVEFVYELRNTSENPIVGLKAKFFCPCSETRPLPTEIPPGKTVQFAFRMRAPLVGIRRSQLALYTVDPSQPLIVLQPAIRANVVPPKITHVPSFVRLHGVKGESSRIDVLINTVERAGSGQFVRRLIIHPRDFVSARLVNVRERKGYDPSVVVRTYQFELLATNRFAETRALNGTITVETQRRTSSQMHKIPVQIRVLEPVALVPDRLDFRISSDAPLPKRRVTIVSRTGSSIGPIVVKHYDETLLEVKTVNQRAARIELFEVTVKRSTPAGTETAIVFQVGAERMNQRNFSCLSASTQVRPSTTRSADRESRNFSINPWRAPGGRGSGRAASRTLVGSAARPEPRPPERDHTLIDKLP